MGITTFSPESDVYSLAATMFYCLTGRKLPRANELYPEVLEKELPKNISPELREILVSALSQRREHRPKDAGAFRRLFNYYDQSTIRLPRKLWDDVTPTKAMEIAEVKVEPVRKKRRWLIPVIVFAVLLVGGAVGYLLTNRGGDSGTLPVTDTTMPAPEPANPVATQDSILAKEELLLQLRAEEDESKKKDEEEKQARDAEEAKKAEEEESRKIKEEEARKAKEEAQKKAEEEKKNSMSQYLHSTPRNFDLCVTWNGKTGFISESDWKKMSASEKSLCSKKGIYLSGDGQRFLLSLNYLQKGDYLNWRYVMSKYGNQLPTKEQLEVIGDYIEILNRVLGVYGAQKLSGDIPSRTKTSDEGVNGFWCLSIYRGKYNAIFDANENSFYHFRAVAPVPVASAI